MKELYEALKEVVDAADEGGWERLDPSFKKQREALEMYKNSMVVHQSDPEINFDGYPLDDVDFIDFERAWLSSLGKRAKKNVKYQLVLRLEQVK